MFLAGPETESMTQEYEFTPDQLISKIGAILGLLLGGSILTLLQCIEYFWKWIENFISIILIKIITFLNKNNSNDTSLKKY